MGVNDRWYQSHYGGMGAILFIFVTQQISQL